MTGTFQNRDVNELTSGGQFALWCLRTWVHCLTQGDSAIPRLRHGLELAGAEDALDELECFLVLLSREATGSITVGCCKCHRTTADEARLLSVFRAGQSQGHGAAVALLSKWLPERLAAVAAGHAQRLARRLQAVDMPIGCIAPTGPAPAVPSDPGLRLIH